MCGCTRLAQTTATGPFCTRERQAGLLTELHPGGAGASARAAPCECEHEQEHPTLHFAPPLDTAHSVAARPGPGRCVPATDTPGA